jgi:hypothetical protein
MKSGSNTPTENITNKDSTNTNKKLSIEEVLELLRKESPGHYHVYKNKEEIANYNQSGASLHGMSEKAILKETIEKAVNLGLDPLLAVKFKLGSAISISNEKDSDESPTTASSSIINIMISKTDGITATIQNGKEGVIKRYQEYEKYNPITKEMETAVKCVEVLRFIGKIGPVIMIDDNMRGLKLSFDGEDYAFSKEDAYSYFRSAFSLSVKLMQQLRELLNSYIENEINAGNFEVYASSPITVIDNVVEVKGGSNQDISGIVRSLRDFYDIASHQTAFLGVLSIVLLAPLHESLKRMSGKGIQAPNVVLSGKSHGGKSPLGYLFIGKGYSLSQDQYYYPYNRVRTQFTLMNHLGESNLPALIDDVPTNWFLKHKEDLKAYAQTGHFGDLGNQNKTLTEYRGRRSFIVTINDDIRYDDDLALSSRMAIFRYGELERGRTNKVQWDAFYDSIPNGFMYNIFKDCFGGVRIEDIVKDVDKFDGVKDWIKYGVEKLNKICAEHKIEPFPECANDSERGYINNAVEIAQAFLGEWNRIENGINETTDRDGVVTQRVKYRSPIEGEFKVVYADGRATIHFTSSAFKTLCARQQLRIPYTTATNFMSNIQPDDNAVKAENNGQPHSIRMEVYPVKAYTISILIDDNQTF